ncbi:MAG: putative DNA binding domain-containing protein, partial [Candidatus Liptonbacteria bacterium]|nr:putative DNA binding domain-containing protein [Candidatus Liptonbacteria bacterium]
KSQGNFSAQNLCVSVIKEGLARPAIGCYALINFKMENEIMVKRSPIVLVWKFAVIETAGFFLYFAATLLGNAKYDLYIQLSFSSILAYPVAKMLFLSGAQFALTVYAFLSWYYEHYIIDSDSVMYKRGVFLRKETMVPISGSTKFTVLRDTLGKFFHYGSVNIKDGKSSLVLATISRPEALVKGIKRGMTHENKFLREPDISKLLAENEHDRLEFKSSLRFDNKVGRASRDVEKAAMKTIAAFLNSKGGYLVVGVSDTRVPLGLQNDYETLQRKDSDGFENHFTQVFNSMIGPEFRNLIKLWFRKLDDRDLCVVQVLASPRPVYLKADNNEQFYMRTGNISTALKLSEIESYSHSRWPKSHIGEA